MFYICYLNYSALENFENIKRNIDSVITLSTDDWGSFKSFIYTIHLEKGDFLLREGSVCKEVAYVNRGVLIYSRNLDNGNEITSDFAFENEWVTNNYSRLNNSPSNLNIKALEQTELLVMSHHDLTNLYETIPLIERFSRILMEQAYLKIVQLSIDLQTLSATERYLKLLQSYPEIFQRVPLYHIANYLGIAPKSLSRIRNSIFSSDK